jgi:hypothetical protein
VTQAAPIAYRPTKSEGVPAGRGAGWSQTLLTVLTISQLIEFNCELTFRFAKNTTYTCPTKEYNLIASVANRRTSLRGCRAIKRGGLEVPTTSAVPGVAGGGLATCAFRAGNAFVAIQCAGSPALTLIHMAWNFFGPRFALQPLVCHPRDGRFVF